MDAAGDIYVGAYVQAPLPASWFSGAVQPTKRAGDDAVIAKISSDGRHVLWATYLGGSGDDGIAPSVRVSDQGVVYVALTTASPDMPVKNAAFPNLSGPSDRYVAALSASAGALLFATYLGGSAGEDSETHGLWLDPQGNAIVTMQGSSTDAPTTAGAYQRTAGGGGDIYVVKLSPTGQMLAATYAGGNGMDGAQGVSTDSQGNIYVAGRSEGGFPVTVKNGTTGQGDLIAIVLSPDLGRLLYSARWGGSGDDMARSLLVDGNGNLLIVAQSGSSNFPTASALQPGFGGVLDGVIVKLTP